MPIWSATASKHAASCMTAPMHFAGIMPGFRGLSRSIAAACLRHALRSCRPPLSVTRFAIRAFARYAGHHNFDYTKVADIVRKQRAQIASPLFPIAAARSVVGTTYPFAGTRLDVAEERVMARPHECIRRDQKQAGLALQGDSTQLEFM